MRKLIPLIMLAAVFAPLTHAHADDCAGTTTANADRPAVVDLAEDWTGNLGAHSDANATVPAGDVFRGGTDILKGWMSGSSGHLVAHIQVGDASKLDRGAEFFFEWTNGDVPPGPLDLTGVRDARRFVEVALKGYEEEYIWGYISPGTGVNGGDIYRTDGNTTGRIVEGANGEIQIDIPTGDTLGIASGAPASGWGSPAVGDTLSLIDVETFLLLGSPEGVPPNPSGLRHGLLEVVDNTLNAGGPDGGDICDQVVDS